VGGFGFGLDIESIILNFRIWLGYGVYENISDPIAKFQYLYTTAAHPSVTPLA